MDAYLAAFAIRSGISLVSIDNDFVRVEPQGLQFRLLPRDWVLEALDGICFKATDCSAQMSARDMDVGPEALKKAQHHFQHGVSPSLAVT